jgi:hypothetical protein
MGWRASFKWAVALAVWLAGLIVVAAVSADLVSSWQRSLDGARAQEQMRWAVDDQFPPRDPGRPLFDYDLPAALRGINREYAGDVALCAALAVGLVAAPFAVRRWVPQERRPGRRAWLLTLPLLAVIALALSVVVMNALGGAIRG